MKFSALSTQALLASSCLLLGSLSTVSGSEKTTVVQEPAGFLRRGLTSYADWKKQQDKQDGKPEGGDKPEKAPKDEKPTKQKPDKPEKPIKEEKPHDETIEDEMEELEEELEEVEEEMEELEDELEELEVEKGNGRPDVPPGQAKNEDDEDDDEDEDEDKDELEELEVEKENGRPDVPPGQAKKEEDEDDDEDEDEDKDDDDNDDKDDDEDEDNDLLDAHCESVWAYDPTSGASTCFSDIEGLKTNRWGWSVGPLADGPTILDIYAAAGGCDLEKGLLLGRAHVMYDAGMDELSIDFERALSELPEGAPLEYEEISWYVGHEPVFQKANGKYTVAPGQFPYKESHIEGSLPTNAVQFDVGSVSDGLPAPLYLTLHGVVCDTAADQL